MDGSRGESRCEAGYAAGVTCDDGVVNDADFTPTTDELLDHNRHFVERFTLGEMAPAPARKVAVVACMDTRLDVYAILGIGPGEAHIMRNAGGVVTDDVVRSLTLSQRALGTREIVLLHHTECGAAGVDEQQFRDDMEAATGARPTWPLHSFEDVHDDVRHSMAVLRSSPFLVDTDHIRGFVYDVRTGALDEVVTDD